MCSGVAADGGRAPELMQRQRQGHGLTGQGARPHPPLAGAAAGGGGGQGAADTAEWLVPRLQR